jgi:hypothetical protein
VLFKTDQKRSKYIFSFPNKMDKLDDDCGSNPTRTPHPGQAEQVAAQPPTMDVMGGKKKKN